MVVAELLVLLSTTSLASSPNFPLGQSTRRKQRIPRTLQSWAIRRQAKPKPTVVIQSNNNSKDPPGSIFTFSKPTKQNIAKWFGVDEDMNQMIRCMLREEFNHDSVGMTNPFLHIDTHDDTNNLLLQVQTTNNENGDTNNIVLPVLQSNTDDSSTGWWPSLLFSPFGKKKWRILTYRVKVGTGRECYERVRDAALDWQFQTNDLGLLSVPSSAEVEMWNLKEKNMPKPPSPYVSGFYRVTPIETTQEESQGESIAFHRSIGSARRLVSFSASRLVPLLPKIYAVNPVMVVYDLVDQR